MSIKNIFALYALITCIGVTAVCAQEADPIPKYAYERRSHEWYVEQAGLWGDIARKNTADANAWLNYYMAVRYAGFGDSEWREQREGVVAAMGKNVPNSFEYNYVQWWDGGNDLERLEYLKKAEHLRPNDVNIIEELATAYEVMGDTEKTATYCRTWYAEKGLPRGILNYTCNVLASLDSNAILVTNGDMDTYPIWLLQHALGMRTDVTVINVWLFGLDDYRATVLNRIGINVDDSVGYGPESSFWKAFAEATNRPLYFGFSIDPVWIESFKEDIYTVGLANRYSPRRIDNIALLKKAWGKFRLDYIDLDFYSENDGFNSTWLPTIHMNYVVPAALLYEHYMLAGEQDKASQFRQFAELRGKEAGELERVLEYLNSVGNGERNGTSAVKKKDQEKEETQSPDYSSPTIK